MRVTIEVTQDDIENGVRNDCRECPIALALKRVVDPNVADAIEVEVSYVGLDDQEHEYDMCNLPPAAEDFIHKFDRKDPVQPFTFDLEIPEWALKGPTQ